MKIQAKILAVTLPLAAVFSGAGALMARRTTQALMIDELGHRLEPQVEDFAAAMSKDLGARHESAILEHLQSAKAFSGGLFAEALLPDGTIAAHTNVLEAGKQRRDPLDVEALSADKPVYRPQYGPSGPMLVVAAPVWRAEDEFLLSGGPRRRLGTLRLGMPLQATLASARRVGRVVAVIAGSVCLFALGLSLALLAHFLRPLRAIAAATARVASGDYGAEVPVASNDELGDLAGAFNRMGETLSRTVVSRDRLEEALAIARAAMEASADGILVVDRNLKVVTYNRRFIEMWGVREETARTGDVRKMAESIKHLVEDPENFMAIVTGSSTREEEERRNIIHLKDGRVFDRISQPFRIGGRVAGRTITTRDLTLHLEGVRALSQARDEALEAARDRSRFLANVSHELRTPLNAVVGAAELMRGTELNAEQKTLADTLERSARGLLDVVSGVLDFSKIDAGRMTVERAPLRPGEILADAAALIAPRAAEKGLTLKIDAGEAGPWDLLGDPTRLRQVLVNLLANAVKFTDSGAIAAEAQVLERSDASALLEFAVHDTGIGIPPDQAARLFTPFIQGDQTTTRRYGGTGLGLAISKSLVELMGGSIGFDSEPGRGTRFWFRLRLDRPDSSASSPPAERPTTPAARRRDHMRVLVVEDNGVNRDLLKRQLTRIGCPCLAVADGAAAVEAARSSNFGLVLLDCQMPGMDGYRTAQAIRQFERGKRRTPIVAVTANVSDEDRRRCLDAGMDDFESKPLSLDSLAAAIERWDRPFDETALGAFAAVVAGGPVELARIIEEMAQDSHARLAAARAALARQDRDGCAREAHTGKGASVSIGARGLAELFRRIESACREGAEAAAFEPLFEQAFAEIARVRAEGTRRGRAGPSST